MKNIAKLFLMLFVFCPVLAAEPNLAGRRMTGDPNILKNQQNSPQNGRRERRLRRRMNFTQADANQRIAGGKEYAQRQQVREKLIGDEYLKNKKRIAILMRIKELAIATNQPQKAQKADLLIQMENQRHRKKIIKFQTRSVMPINRLEKTEPNNK